MNILVTGSKGIIGKWLVKKLKAKGHDVFGVDLFHSLGEVGYIQKMSHNDFIYSRCDISEYRQIRRIFDIKNFEMVFNCAAEFGRWNGEDYYEQVWKSNVIGLKNIINLQEEYNFKLVHFSSSEVYGDYKDLMTEKIMDKVEIKQLNDYALSKWTNEQQIKNSIKLNNLKTVIVRIFNTYGPGEIYHPYRSVNSKFCYNLLMGIPIDVYKGHYRTSTYLEDSVTTISNIVDNFISGEVYNIGGWELHSIEELVEIIQKHTKCSSKLIRFIEHEEKLTTKIKKVDITNSINHLNHQNTVNLNDGVFKTIDWMKKYYSIE